MQLPASWIQVFYMLKWEACLCIRLLFLKTPEPNSISCVTVLSSCLFYSQGRIHGFIQQLDCGQMLINKSAKGLGRPPRRGVIAGRQRRKRGGGRDVVVLVSDYCQGWNMELAAYVCCRLNLGSSLSCTSVILQFSVLV